MDTSPAALAELVEDGNDKKFKTYVVLTLSAHTSDIKELKDKAATVSSSVNDYNENKAELRGAKRLWLGLLAIVAAIGGCIVLALQLADYFGKKP